MIAAVFRLLGVFNTDSPAPQTDINNAEQALDLMIKSKLQEGKMLWTIEDITIALAQGQGGPGNPYILGPSGVFTPYKPLRIEYARLNYATTGGNDVQLIELSRQEYNLLGNKTDQGTPNSFYWDPQTTYGNLQVYVTPDAYNAANNVIILTVRRPLMDMSTSITDFDFPIECLNAIKWGLADQLALEYDIPDAKQAIIAARAQKYWDDLLDFSTEETSVSFMPDFTRWSRK